MLKITYFSHSMFMIDDGINQVVIDPFITGNPTYPSIAPPINAKFIVLTHGHGDHLGNGIDIARKNDGLIIAVNELANFCAEKGAKSHNMHIGGSYNFPFGRLKFTIAHHGSSSPDGRYMGEPAGVVITINNKNIYHSGDTGLFLDMKLIGELNKIDVACLPIGDNFTMGVDDAVKAVEFINPKLAIPMHYNTFPVIQANPIEFRKKVEMIGKKARVLEFGETITID